MSRLLQASLVLSLLGGLSPMPGVAIASEPLFPTPVFQVADEITYVTSGEINNDGKIDLIVLHGGYPGSSLRRPAGEPSTDRKSGLRGFSGACCTKPTGSS